MCDPLSIAGAALTVGSTLLSSVAARKQERARENAVAQSLAQQSELQRRAISRLGQVAEGFTPERLKEKIDQASVRRNEMIQGAVEGGGDPNALVREHGVSENAPKIVRETAARELGRGLEEGRKFAGNLARLGAFGEAQFDQNVSLGRLGETLGQIGAESRGVSNILPYQLQAANEKGSTLRGIADILGATGSVANLGGAVGANAGLNTAGTGFSILPDFIRSAPPGIPQRNPFITSN